MDQYRDMLNLSYVQRWVIMPTNRPQSVAEHSYRVAIIAMALLDHCSIPGREYVIRACLSHDVEEVYTGDIPGPDKDKTKEWPNPSTMLKGDIVVKLADIIETWSWGVMHVVNPLTRPNGFDSTASGRDIRKILHYVQDWPYMRETVRIVVKELFGITMEGV